MRKGNLGRWLVAGLLVALVAACESEGGGGGGGADGAGGGNGGDGDCAGVCSALMAAECYYMGGEDDCNTSCTGWDALYATRSADCQDVWAAYKDCMVGADMPNCDGVATWNPMACRAEWDHTQNYCVNGKTPAEPCLENAAWDAFCAGVEGKPKGTVCQGDVPADCVIGGTPTNADLYCCP